MEPRYLGCYSDLLLQTLNLLEQSRPCASPSPVEFVSSKASRCEGHAVKTLRGVGDGIGEGEGAVGGGDGTAQVGPVGRVQAGTGLQLVCPARLRAPSQIQRAVGERQGLELRHNGQPENGSGSALAALGSRAVKPAVSALH